MRYVIFLMIVLFSTTAFGQRYGPFVYGGYRHASTIAEGYGRGLGDVTRSRGLANLYNSRARINNEIARQKYIENRKLWTQTYFEMRDINREWRFGNLVAPTQEDLARRAKEKLPDRLPEGKIQGWPILLRASEFDLHRTELEVLFKMREEMGQLEIGHVIRVDQIVEEMEAIIFEYKGHLKGNITIEARKFLASIRYESDMVVGG